MTYYNIREIDATVPNLKKKKIIQKIISRNNYKTI